jgi:hypothetical protein
MYSLSDFNETLVFSTGFPKKYSNIKFHENPPSEGRVAPCGQTEGHADMKKLVDTFAISLKKTHMCR